LFTSGYQSINARNEIPRIKIDFRSIAAKSSALVVGAHCGPRPASARTPAGPGSSVPARRHRIGSAPTPWVTTPQPLQGQPSPTPRAMSFNRLHRVYRATRVKPAPRRRPQHRQLQGRERPAVNPDQHHQNPLCRVHGDASNLARRITPTKSRSTSSNRFPTIEGRATSTASTGTTKSGRCTRNTSRNKRFARFRTTAGPTLRLATTPTRAREPNGNRRQFAIKHPCTTRSPSSRNARKSRRSRNRAARGSPNPGRADVILQHLQSNRSQALAPLASPVRQHLATALRRVPLPETILPFAADLGWLVGSFHACIIRSPPGVISSVHSRQRNSRAGEIISEGGGVKLARALQTPPLSAPTAPAPVSRCLHDRSPPSSST
jgi:hypothetical protein